MTRTTDRYKLAEFGISLSIACFGLLLLLIGLPALVGALPASELKPMAPWLLVFAICLAICFVISLPVYRQERAKALHHA